MENAIKRLRVIKEQLSVNLASGGMNYVLIDYILFHDSYILLNILDELIKFWEKFVVSI